MQFAGRRQAMAACVAVVGAMACVGVAAQSLDSKVDNQVDSRVASDAVDNGDRVAARRDDMRQFRDAQGNFLLTNRPEKYRARKGYVEVKIRYEPITVAPRYKRMPSAKAYTSGNIQELVRHYAKRYVLDENLVYAVIRAESNFDPYAVSSAGARGLMQLMPETAADMGVDDIFDPAQNIAGGTQYLAKMLNLFNNDITLALAAYNAGPQAVKDHGGIPPYQETKDYVKAVCKYAALYSKGAEKAKYNVLSAKPDARALPPKKGKYYVVYFKRGWTFRVNQIVDEGDFYYVQYGANKSGVIRKEHVEKIVENEKPPQPARTAS